MSMCLNTSICIFKLLASQTYAHLHVVYILRICSSTHTHTHTHSHTHTLIHKHTHKHTHLHTHTYTH